jgi:hypothetical protein
MSRSCTRRESSATSIPDQPITSMLRRQTTHFVPSGNA